MKSPRVALFTDCFHDVNGAALTCRQLQAFAERRRLPLLCVRAGSWAERFVFQRLTWFFRLPRLLFAPNSELLELRARHTGRLVLPMRRGVDCRAFSPDHRQRTGNVFVLRFSGRLRAEKNVWFLVEVERALLKRGHRDFRFLICGDGTEAAWLRAHREQAEFPGLHPLSACRPVSYAIVKGCRRFDMGDGHRVVGGFGRAEGAMTNRLSQTGPTLAAPGFSLKMPDHENQEANKQNCADQH